MFSLCPPCLSGRLLNSYRRNASQALRLLFTKAHRVLGEVCAEDFRRFALADAACYLTQFIDKGIDGIAAGELRVSDVAIRIQQHRFAEIAPCPADDCEIECNSCPFQVNFERVCERSA